MKTPAVLLAVLAFHVEPAIYGSPRDRPTPLLDLQNKMVVLPMSKGDQAGTLKINGTQIAVQDSRLPSVLLSLYQNISKEIYAVPNPKLRSAFRDSLEVTLLKSIEDLVVPGLDDKRKAKIRNLKFGANSDGFNKIERGVLVTIIVVVVVVALVVFVYWFVTTVLQAVLTDRRSEIGLTELEDLDVYSTDVDDEVASLTRHRNDKRAESCLCGKPVRKYEKLR
ncbi:hypothetical protein ISCGN_032630 [Ixodes scapularis]